MIPYCEFNATDYPAYIDVNYHECMFFVCETLYINVYIQTGNNNTENWKKKKKEMKLCSKYVRTQR